MNFSIEQIIILAVLFFGAGFTIGKEKAEYKFSYWISQEPESRDEHKDRIVLVTTIWLRNKRVWQKETNCGENLSDIKIAKTNDWCDASALLAALKDKK